VARFEHNPITFESLGLEIEEQRTNLVTYSEQFDNAAWTKSNATITANTVVAPDGTLTGDQFVENASNALHDIRQVGVAATALTAHTFSFYVKAAGRTRGEVQMFGNSGGNSVTFDLSAGTVNAAGAYGGWSSASASITNVGNGWYRVTNTATTNSGLTSLTVFLCPSDASGNATYTGNGYSGLFIWGAQLEAGAFPTSYIQTVASQVTRAADAASMTGTNFSSWYNQAEGTLYADFATTTVSLANNLGVFGVSDGTTSERIQLRRNAATAFVSFLVVDNGATQFVDSGTLSFSGSARSALAYKVNDFIGASNQLLGVADTAGTVPTVSQAEFGFGQGISQLNGTIRKIAYYPLRVTNANLQALTS
jgi:hypothetical protein